VAANWGNFYSPNALIPGLQVRTQVDNPGKKNRAQFRSTHPTTLTFKWQPVGAQVGKERLHPELRTGSTGGAYRCDEVSPLIDGPEGIQINVYDWVQVLAAPAVSQKATGTVVPAPTASTKSRKAVAQRSLPSKKAGTTVRRASSAKKPRKTVRAKKPK
jgi:hypothetical protein